MSQLDLHLGIGCLCSLCKDFQNKACTVYYRRAFNNLFYIALLHSCKFVVEYYVIYGVLLYIGSYFLEFSATYVRSLVGAVYTLYELPVTFYSGSLCKEFQFLKIFHYLAFIVPLLYYTNEYSFFY